MRNLMIACAIFAFTLASAPTARRARVHDFNEAVAPANGFYRAA